MHDKTNGKYILLVAENDIDILLVRMALAKFKITLPVTIINDGAAAIEYMANASRIPVVILLDPDIPKVTGLTVLGRIRKDARFQHVPVLIISAIYHPQDINIAKSMGANAYIYKAELFKILGDALAAVGITASAEIPPAEPGARVDQESQT